MAQYVDSDYISKQEEHTIGGSRLLSSPFVLRGRNTNKSPCLFPAYVNRDPFFNSRPQQISIHFAWYLFFGGRPFIASQDSTLQHLGVQVEP